MLGGKQHDVRETTQQGVRQEATRTERKWEKQTTSTDTFKVVTGFNKSISYTSSMSEECTDCQFQELFNMIPISSLGAEGA